MNKLMLSSLSGIMLIFAAGCYAGTGPHGVGASIGYHDTADYST